MGLLDFLNTGDPQKDAAVSRGLLQAGLQLMQTKGRFLPGLSQGGLAGLQGFDQAQQQQYQQKLQKAQLEAIERKKMLDAREDTLANLPGEFIKPASQGNNPSAYTPGSQDIEGLIQKYMATPGGLQTGLNLAASVKKDTTPIKGAPGEVFFDPVTKRPLFSVPSKPENQPSALQEYQFAVGQGYKGTFTDWDRERKKAGAANTNVKIDNKLGEGLAKEFGPIVADSLSQAQGAQQQIQNADSIIRAVESNKVFAGPGANIKLKGAQLGQVLGVGGRDAQEQIANTRQVIQGLARATVAARAALKGQGSVSDFEGKLLARAESGDIEDMTAAEIRQIAEVNKRLAGLQIQKHKALIQRARGNKATEGLAGLFEVDDETPVLRYNPSTGKLER